MTPPTIWRFMAIATFVIVAIAGICNAQKPQASAVPAQTAAVAKPAQPLNQQNPPVAAANGQKGAAESAEEESEEEAPPVKASGNAPVLPSFESVVQAAAANQNKTNNAAPQGAKSQEKATQKPIGKNTQPPSEVEGEESNEESAISHPPQPSAAKQAQPAAAVPAVQPLKNETIASQKPALPAAAGGQESAEEESEEVPAPASPLAPANATLPQAAKAGSKAPLKPTIAPVEEAEESAEVTSAPKAANGTKAIIPAGAKAQPAEAASEEESSKEESEIKPAAPTKPNNASIDGSNKAAAKVNTPKPASPQAKVVGGEDSEELDEEARLAGVTTKRPTTIAVPTPKATSPEPEVSEESEEEESSGKPSPIPAQPALNKNAASSKPTPVSPKPIASPPSASPHNPQSVVNVPGGPSFQPLEGGAVPPVLARANAALAAAAAVPPQNGPAKGTPRPNQATTPAAEEGSEEAEEYDGSGDDSGFIAAVNTEYASALKNLSSLGLLPQSEFSNKHLSDLFALLLENSVSAHPNANEKDQIALVHKAAAEFQEIFKAKAASTKNISEIVRLLNEQIVSAPVPGQLPSAGIPLATAKPFAAGGSAPVAGNATSKAQPKTLSAVQTAAPLPEESVTEEGEEGSEEEGTGSPQVVNLQTLHLLQNASANASFPFPPAWKSSPAPIPHSANGTTVASSEENSGEASQEINGTAIDGAQPTQPTVAVANKKGSTAPAPEPAPTTGESASASIPVAEPKPSPEPGPKSAVTGPSIEVTAAGNETESAESEETESPSAPAVTQEAGPNTTESFWAGGESASPEPSPKAKNESGSSTKAVSIAVIPWSFKIVDPKLEWDSELNNKESFQYKTLYGSLISDLKTIFKRLEPQRFLGVSIKQFSQGSIIVEGQTDLKERVESGQLLENFLKVLKEQDNKIGGHIIDPVAITFDGRPSVELARDGSAASASTPAWIIGLSVGGVLLAAIIIAAVLIVVRLLRNRRSRSISSVDGSKASPLPQHVIPVSKRGSQASSAGYDTPYATRADYYRYYQAPYVAPGAMARTFMTPPNYYSPYYQHHQQSAYSYW